jgi:hypothetical protein
VQHDVQNTGRVSCTKVTTASDTSAFTTLGQTPHDQLPQTLEASNEKERLVAAVTNMAISQPPVSFAARFLLTSAIVRGGQSIVVFARSCDAGMRQFAIKCAPCAA